MTKKGFFKKKYNRRLPRKILFLKVEEVEM